jgi:hypothetical protein
MTAPTNNAAAALTGGDNGTAPTNTPPANEPAPNGSGTPAAANPAPADNSSGNPQPNAAANGQAPDLKSLLGEEYAPLADKKGWQNVQDLAKGYVNIEKMIGGDPLVMPADDAAPEEWSKFYNRLGRPDTPDGYELSEMPEGYERNEALSDWFKKSAHELGLNQKAAKELDKRFNEFMANYSAQQQEELGKQGESEKAALQKEWGNTYDENMALAQAAAEKLGGEKVAKAIQALEGQVGFQDTVKLFTELGKMFGDDKFIQSASARATGFGMSPEQAKMRIKEIESDPAYLNPDPATESRHKSLVQEAQRLYEVAYSGEE